MGEFEHVANDKASSKLFLDRPGVELNREDIVIQPLWTKATIDDIVLGDLEYSTQARNRVEIIGSIAVLSIKGILDAEKGPNIAHMRETRVGQVVDKIAALWWCPHIAISVDDNPANIDVLTNYPVDH